jgi:hypothetical protein
LKLLLCKGFSLSVVFCSVAKQRRIGNSQDLVPQQYFYTNGLVSILEDGAVIWNSFGATEPLLIDAPSSVVLKYKGETFLRDFTKWLVSEANNEYNIKLRTISGILPSLTYFPNAEELGNFEQYTEGFNIGISTQIALENDLTSYFDRTPAEVATWPYYFQNLHTRNYSAFSKGWELELSSVLDDSEMASLLLQDWTGDPTGRTINPLALDKAVYLKAVESMSFDQKIAAGITTSSQGLVSALRNIGKSFEKLQKTSASDTLSDLASSHFLNVFYHATSPENLLDAAQNVDDYFQDVDDPARLIQFQDDMLKALNQSDVPQRNDPDFIAAFLNLGKAYAALNPTTNEVDGNPIKFFLNSLWKAQGDYIPRSLDARTGQRSHPLP